MIADLPPTTVVTMPGRFFAPAHVSVLSGESLTWRNTDGVAHVVLDSTDGIDSGRMSPGGEFTFRFERTGTYRYVCTIHRTMRGVVEVASIALTGPSLPAAAGTTVTLTGRAPAGTGEVEVERVGQGVIATVGPASDGTFSLPVLADAPAAYRARSGPLFSRAVAVGVAPQVRVSAGRAGDRVSIRIHVPGQPGARVMLEHYERERFGYLPLRSARLGGGARVHMVLRTAKRLRLRVRLSRPVGGFARATSAPFVIGRKGSAMHDHGAILGP
jgi:hypothetical protein